MELYLGEAFATLYALKQVPSMEEQIEAMRIGEWFADHAASCLTCRWVMDAYGICGCDPGPIED